MTTNGPSESQLAAPGMVGAPRPGVGAPADCIAEAATTASLRRLYSLKALCQSVAPPPLESSEIGFGDDAAAEEDSPAACAASTYMERTPSSSQREGPRFLSCRPRRPTLTRFVPARFLALRSGILHLRDHQRSIWLIVKINPAQRG